MVKKKFDLQMVRVLAVGRCFHLELCTPKSREAAERMVDDHALLGLPNAIQRTELTSEVMSDQPTITDSECEINAGAYAE